MPSNNDVVYKYHLDIDLTDLSVVKEFTGMAFPELLALDIYTYRVFLVNAFVKQARSTEKGNQMLNDYERVFGEHREDADTSGLESLMTKHQGS